VGIVSNSHIKTNNATLSEQFQSSIEKWKTNNATLWSDSVALLVFLWDFWTVLTVCHYLFYYWTLELFREFSIIGFSFFSLTLELFRQCGIIYFYTTLSEQFQSSIEKWKTNNATLSDQFQSHIEKTNATLSEHFQRSIDKQMRPHCRNSVKDHYKNK
jgi:hypothetical protein